MTFTLFNASAGSGKTYRLTHELADRIAAGLEPSQLIATTFTRKAAAELSGRIRSTLLDEGLVEAARDTDSALIGTVNSVAGRLLREHAIDAGVSPDVREIDENGQRRAFSAALDDAIAHSGSLHRDLLARLEHDKAEDDDSFGTGVSWQRQVRDVAEKARSNRIAPEAVRAAAANSWESWRTAAGLTAASTDTNTSTGTDTEHAAPGSPAPGDGDRRSAWMAGLQDAITALDTALADGTYTNADGETTKIRANSVRTTEKAREDLASLLRTLRRTERAPWSAWAKLAAIAADVGENAKGGVKPKDTYGAVADHLLFPLASRLVDELPACPALHADIRALIELVMGTAADSLAAYAEHKRALGLIDFVDQEVLLLELLRSSERVREAVRTRFRLLAVDEFQDTSPVQLALFVELSRLIDDKIWVGDPKQAIYGFRGADPALMESVLEAVEHGGTELGKGLVQNLAHSWRSAPEVLALSNAVFAEVFAETPLDRVLLEIPDERRTSAPGGRVEAWSSAAGGRASRARHAATIAEGVRDLLGRGTAPGDVAVLAPKNADVTAVLEALALRGVPATGAAPAVLATREGQILQAGLASVIDPSDSLALVTLVELLEDHGAHAAWFADLARATDRESRAAVRASWWEDPTLTALGELRSACIGLSPVEMIDALIDALDLIERIRTWSDPRARRGTLDAIRALAARFTDEAASASEPVTLTGLRLALDAAETGADLSARPDAVWVGTIHAAKGLEWPTVVVMLTAPRSQREGPFGVTVLPAAELDIAAPLAGRRIRYWPRVLTTYGPVREGLSADADAQRRAREEQRERGRLQYVALTRAARVSVLCTDAATTPLDGLGPQVEDAGPLVTIDPVTEEIRVARRRTDPSADCRETGCPGEACSVTTCAAMAESARTVPIIARSFAAEEDPVALPGRAGAPAMTDIPRRPAADAPAHPAARFRASGVASDGLRAEIVRVAVLGDPLVRGGGAGWDRVGEAVHGYLALPLAELDAAARLRAAERLRARWQVERAVPAAVIVTAGERWCAYLAAEHAGAEVLTEQPIAGWNEEAQAMEGWIDTLLRSPDGSLVLVDHKTYPGEQPEEHIRKSYLGQFAAYARALEAATGRAPSRLLVHLPLRGEVWEVGPITPA
ncbi:UvrD-helicase domain-containing protein [Brachybacterium nesterenkovii]|uniref:DNA 3'-5' helicase n=1 Tax=Brachybacterium nesterenkovii TaxID=47847 RepID=A0A1X6WWT9_9MICO|nr:UvrD-helicase domain-containing protein [Brachybacterium nesterenkovii]SLM89977.1 probable ATP-dependent DNA helicase [Brachybacterium nesterenkovii]